MKRRRFFKTAAACTAAALGGPTACNSPREGSNESRNRTADVEPFELDEISISDLCEGIRSGKYTAQSLAGLYLARIQKTNLEGPRLHAVIETNPEAMQIARDLDEELKSKGPRGPLHGLPILVKDNIGTADKVTTTAGSLALEGSIPLQDSGVATLLREAGAVILGKANMSEWANIRSTAATSGWSARGGLCRNPYALDRTPIGSSSGSAVAAAASLCAAAIGTETDGSITSPANVNSLVGIKPTVGLIPATGIIPISHSQDTAGPLCRNVQDAAILLGALAGKDARETYSKDLESSSLKGRRLGVFPTLASNPPPMVRPISSLRHFA